MSLCHPVSINLSVCKEGPNSNQTPEAAIMCPYVTFTWFAYNKVKMTFTANQIGSPYLCIPIEEVILPYGKSR